MAITWNDNKTTPNKNKRIGGTLIIGMNLYVSRCDKNIFLSGKKCVHIFFFLGRIPSPPGIFRTNDSNFINTYFPPSNEHRTRLYWEWMEIWCNSRCIFIAESIQTITSNICTKLKIEGNDSNSGLIVVTSSHSVTQLFFLGYLHRLFGCAIASNVFLKQIKRILSCVRSQSKIFEKGKKIPIFFW